MININKKVNVSLGWGVGRMFGFGLGRDIGDELDIDVGDKVGERIGLEVGSKVVPIKIPKMKSMWILMTVYTDILTEVLILKFADVIISG